MPEDIEEECRLRREEAERLTRAAEESRRAQAEEHEREMRKWQELREHRRRKEEARRARRERPKQAQREQENRVRREQEILAGERAERERIWAEAYDKAFREWHENKRREAQAKRRQTEVVVTPGLEGVPENVSEKPPQKTLGNIVVSAATRRLKGMLVSYCLYKAREALFGDEDVNDE